MTKPRRKSRAKKPKSTAARVVAVKHLPSEGVPKDALADYSPYVTDHGLTDFFAELAAIVPSPASSEQSAMIAQEALEYIAARMPPVADDEMPTMAAVALSRLQEALYSGAYGATKVNPVYAIEAFVAFHHLGLYPPLWVLEWLNGAFVAYMESGGDSSLDALLGVKRGKGQTQIWKEAQAINIEAKVMREIAGLTYVGISVENAAVMVAGRLEAVKLNCPSPETLAERYSKRGWAKAFKPLKPVSATISPEDKKAILGAYPKHTIPTKFR